MSKLLVTANSLEHLNELLDKDIYGMMLYVDKLSVNSSFYILLEELEKIDFKSKKIFLVMNKLIHNKDIDMVKDILFRIKDMDVKILFYDMAIYNISKEYDILDKLVIYQDHLNASIDSNNFYYDLGINGSYITSDITLEELLDIKKNTKMDVYFMGYGYAPIFYSRRYLIKNYLKFIDKEDYVGKYTILSDMGNEYPISEEEYGTTIYSDKVINLINYLDRLDEVDYVIMNSNMIDNDEYSMVVDKFINKDKMDDCYLGFFNTKTIYRVKGKE